MPSILTQKDVRRLQRLTFCYVCGELLPPERHPDRNDDHVPPETCFAHEDRTFPLKLPTHVACNIKRHLVDEMMGQLFLHRNKRHPGADRIRLTGFNVDTGNPADTVGVLDNLDINREVWHWIRAFHAALYCEHLDERASIALESPFPIALRTPQGPIPVPLKAQHQVFVRTIKANRAANNLDRIHSNNGKMRYECVWDIGSDRRWHCIFALDIYGWRDFGDLSTIGHGPRGCAGCYAFSDGRRPSVATKATVLLPVMQFGDLWDAFSD